MYILKVKGWIRISYANTNEKKVGVTIFISDKADFIKENYQE